MSKAHIFVTICLVVFVANYHEMSVIAQGRQNSACLENSEEVSRFAQCKFSWECCSGCCNEGRCSTRNAKCIDDQHPCQTINCQEGSSCQLVPVNCLVPPCPPQASCRSPVNPNPCSNVTCNAGEHCELSPVPPHTPARCVKDSSCDGHFCAPGSTCVIDGKRPRCVASCERFDCSAGSRCSLQLFNVCQWERCDLTPDCLPVSG